MHFVNHDAILLQLENVMSWIKVAAMEVVRCCWTVTLSVWRMLISINFFHVFLFTFSPSKTLQTISVSMYLLSLKYYIFIILSFSSILLENFLIHTSNLLAYSLAICFLLLVLYYFFFFFSFSFFLPLDYKFHEGWNFYLFFSSLLYPLKLT